MYDDKVFIGKTLQEIRKRANMKQAELAEKIGISEKHLSKIETGKNFPSLNNFLKMAEVLNFSLKEFGIVTDEAINIDRTELLKTIYNASDFELKSYLDIIKTLDHIFTYR